MGGSQAWSDELWQPSVSRGGTSVLPILALAPHCILLKDNEPINQFDSRAFDWDASIELTPSDQSRWRVTSS